MGYVLTGDQQQAFFRKLGELNRQLGQAEFPYDPDLTLSCLQALIEGRFFEGGHQQFPSLLIASDLIPKANGKPWEMVEDCLPVPGVQQDLKNLEPLPFLRNGERCIGGEEMRRRAVEISCNYSLAEGKMWLENQAEIPSELRPYYIPLTGTVLRDPDGDLQVGYLIFGDGRWRLNFSWLGCDWYDSFRFARRK